MTALSVVPPADQQRWHESYKAAPLVIILLYMRTRGDRPVTQSEISENFMIARNTAATALRKLALQGLIGKVDHNKGYILTEGGRQRLLGLDEQPGCSKIEHPSLKESFFKLKDSKDLKDMKERKNEMLKNCAPEKILSETGKLWPGREVVTFGLSKDLQPDFILAWIAQAYDQHQLGKISYPWALVYRRLQTNRTLPDKKYQADPLQYLPNDFLVALNLAEPSVIDADDYAGCEGIIRVSKYTCVVDGFVDNAWARVLKELGKEMPKASFETWVMNTSAVHYENNILSIAVCNQYAKDWLESRLTDTVEKMLVGILNNTEIRVEFVVLFDDEMEP